MKYQETMLCGITGNCSKEIYYKEDGSYRKILGVSNVAGILVLGDTNNGFHDIELGGRGFKFPVWSYDRKKYQLSHFVKK